MAANLLLINGLPGTGKTTLATRLSHDLAYPMLGKDALKEWLYDNMQVPMKDDAKLLGKSSAKTLYTLMQDFMEAGRPLIVENAFQVAHAQPEVQRIIDRTGARCIEIYCTTELTENRRRYTERIISGARHPIHGDTVAGFVVDDAVRQKYAPIAVGRTIHIDTTHFGDEEYNQLLQVVRKELA